MDDFTRWVWIAVLCLSAAWTGWLGYRFARRGGGRWVVAIMLWLLAAGLLFEVGIQTLLRASTGADVPQKIESLPN